MSVIPVPVDTHPAILPGVRDATRAFLDHSPVTGTGVPVVGLFQEALCTREETRLDPVVMSASMGMLARVGPTQIRLSSYTDMVGPARGALLEAFAAMTEVPEAGAEVSALQGFDLLERQGVLNVCHFQWGTLVHATFIPAAVSDLGPKGLARPGALARVVLFPPTSAHDRLAQEAMHDTLMADVSSTLVCCGLPRRLCAGLVLDFGHSDLLSRDHAGA